MIELTDENFEKETQNASKPVLVDFWAEWCAPCFVLTPTLEKLANEFEGKFILAKVNLNEARRTSQKYGIEKIPMVILFNEGKPLSGFIGVRSEPQIREWLEKSLEMIGQEKEKTEGLIKDYEDYAEKNSWRLNPDRKIVERLVMGMLANEKKYRARYCVCRRITGDPEKDKTIICPCVYASREIEEQGHCFCSLFLKKENDEK